MDKAPVRGVQHYRTAKGEDRWRCVVLVDGKRKSLSFTDYASAVKFKQRCRKYGNAEAVKITDVENAGTEQVVTINEAFELYLSERTRPSHGTIVEYGRIARRSWLQEFDDLSVRSVTRERIVKWVQERGGQVSAKTLRSEFILLSATLEDCVARDILARNPATGVKLAGAKAVERMFISREEFDLLCSHVEPRWLPLIHTIGATGLRWGEATALRWRDIDLTAGTLHVAQAWKRAGVGQGHRVIGTPKTKKGTRTISLFADTVTHLAALKASRGDVDPDAFVFVGRDGRTPPTHAKFMTYVWNPARDAAGLDPRVTPHSLRHSHASWLLATGLPTWNVTQRLGHETTQITERVYGHFVPDMRRLTDAALSEALGPRTQQLPSSHGS